MAKIARLNANYLAFALNALAGERTIFNDVGTSNTLDANITADFLRGWGIVGPSDFPTKQDFNAAFFTLGQTLAYLHQMGVAEWNVNQEFHQGALALGSDFVTYKLDAVSDTGTDPVGDLTGVWLIFTNEDLQMGKASFVTEDAGSAADAYIIKATIGQSAAAAYFDNMNLVFDIVAPSTGGAVTLDAFGLGAKSVKTPSGSDPSAGEMSGRVRVSFDTVLDLFVLVQTISYASQAEQEAGTESAKAVAPATQQFHPSAAKAWVIFDGTGVLSVLDSYGVSSVTDLGVGDYRINLVNDFDSVNFCAPAVAGDGAGGERDIRSPAGEVPTVSTLRLRTTNGDQVSNVDAEYVSVAFFGVLA